MTSDLDQRPGKPDLEAFHIFLLHLLPETVLFFDRPDTGISKIRRDMDLAMGAETTPSGHIYDPSDLDAFGRPTYPDPDNPKLPRNGHRIAQDLCLYCLRHSYCTDLQRQGVPLTTAQYLMGHSNISVTADIYTHSGDAEVIAAGQLIDAATTKTGSD